MRHTIYFAFIAAFSCVHLDRAATGSPPAQIPAPVVAAVGQTHPLLHRRWSGLLDICILDMFSDAEFGFSCQDFPCRLSTVYFLLSSLVAFGAYGRLLFLSPRFSWMRCDVEALNKSFFHVCLKYSQCPCSMYVVE